ncbi:hypothetical protein MYSEV_037 [Mythimna separata entomopoxvirus 'L']|uniref:Uncharacterized protein n=1 Tax=Mythimna separata entomopoxvirus 'L' TaxID=1293572 RepID=A0A916KQ82_9POXV|nr:hypothetical protein MYSEV_037 [Mythimna separata entomopoxvirus 'L']CCU56235.1 hypothetical protein MYSEV_037 [Mythimna separata entomopoxvirus 'L']
MYKNTRNYYKIINILILLLLQIIYVFLVLYNVQLTYIKCYKNLNINDCDCIIYNILSISLIIFGLCVGYINYIELHFNYNKGNNYIIL